jgi:biopolymer transport protein ExbD
MENESQNSFTSINVTPLVDVSLVLVLIFMVTSPFFAKPLLPVRLPEAGAAKSEDARNITVSVSPETGVAVNETPVALDNLGRELKNRIDETGFDFVLVRADERVPSGEVQDVLRLAKRAGAKRIAFAATPRVQS